jgi:hypothetical protein
VRATMPLIPRAKIYLAPEMRDRPPRTSITRAPATIVALDSSRAYAQSSAVAVFGGDSSGAAARLRHSLDAAMQ